jgi:hypothetical protein
MNIRRTRRSSANSRSCQLAATAGEITDTAYNPLAAAPRRSTKQGQGTAYRRTGSRGAEFPAAGNAADRRSRPIETLYNRDDRQRPGVATSYSDLDR